MIIFRKLILVCFLGLSFFLLDAQDNKISYPDFKTGITPSSLLNGYRGVQFSLDKGVNPNLNLASELAYIFTSPYNAQGFRIRTGLEKYVLRSEIAGLSLGLHGHYRWTKEFRTLLENASNGEFQRITHHYKRTRNYFGAVGTMNLLFKSGENWTWEFGGGLGAARYIIKGNQEPLSDRQFFENRVDFFIDWSYDIGPIFYLHFNVSYVISS